MMPELAPPPTQERLTDSDIAAAVERLYQQKKGVAAALIEVVCREGIVELRGFTNSLLSRGRAADIAKAVRGVRGVINEISIRTPDVPDAELQRRAELALLQDPAAGGYNIRCCAQHGELSVEGTLQSWAEEQLVLHVLLGVPGARQINNRLHVRGGGLTNSDEEITTQIREFLAWDIRVKSALVNIRTEQGVVHLSGTVGSAAEHDQVVATAYVAGATHVEARDLFVAYWALDQALRRLKFSPKTDEAIAQAIRDALRYDLRVDSYALTVHVREGVVTLLGGMSSLRARLAAEQDAGNVVGVLAVHNLLQVHVQNPSPDTAIAGQIIAALADDAYVGSYAFSVTVNAGKVQLHGTVDAHFDQERAADVAAGSAGVVALENYVQVCAERFAPHAEAEALDFVPLPVNDAAADLHLEQRIRDHYDWSALLHDQDIAIEVREGRVTLTGYVDTWRDRKQAAADAYSCGAGDVNNHLHLTVTE